MKLCFLASLSTDSDDICFIFPVDRSCDTLQHTKPGWFLKRALQRMSLSEKQNVFGMWTGPSSAWRWIWCSQGVVPVAALNAGSGSWVQLALLWGFPREIQQTRSLDRGRTEFVMWSESQEPERGTQAKCCSEVPGVAAGGGSYTQGQHFTESACV